MANTLTIPIPENAEFSKLQTGLTLKAIAIIANTIDAQQRVSGFHISDEIQKRLARSEKVPFELQDWLSTLEDLTPDQLLVIMEAIAAYVTSKGTLKDVEL